MKIQLKSVKHYPSMSQETECFEASVYVDGKKVGFISNDGQGGSNDWRLDKDAEAQIKAHVDSLPSESLTFSGKTHEFKIDMDYFFSNLLSQYLKEKEAAKLEKWAQKEKAKFVAFGCSGAIQIQNGVQLLIAGIAKNKTAEETFQEVCKKRDWKNASFAIL
jgi:hypothetical protein